MGLALNNAECQQGAYVADIDQRQAVGATLFVRFR